MKAKLFVIHGKRDKTIEVRHSHLLYDKYVYSCSDNNQIWLVIAEGAGHNDIQFLIEDAGGPFFKRIQKFLEMIKNPLKLIEARKESKNYDKFMKREENKLFFYEKEVHSLKISFNKLVINHFEVEDSLKKSDGQTNISLQVQEPLENEKEFEEKEFIDLLRKNDSYFSKEIPHEISDSVLNGITLKKSKSATHSTNIPEENGGTLVKEFKNVNELLIKNYFDKF